MAAQQVSDQQLETARFRFPYNTPTSKEAYLYREIFEELFPLPSAAECVPGGPSVACSSAKAIEWDEAFKKWTIRLVARLAFTSRHINKTCNIAPEKSGAISVTGALVDSDMQ